MQFPLSIPNLFMVQCSAEPKISKSRKKKKKEWLEILVSNPSMINCWILNLWSFLIFLHFKRIFVWEKFGQCWNTVNTELKLFRVVMPIPLHVIIMFSRFFQAVLDKNPQVKNSYKFFIENAIQWEVKPHFIISQYKHSLHVLSVA